MPAQEIAQPNPPPDASLLPHSIASLGVTLDYANALSPDELKSVQAYRRAADYIAAAMIFLHSNTLLTKPLTFSDIKPRLLGHWGTCPGLVIVYAHVNRLIVKHDIDCLMVVGPGHGAPAILSCLWLEDSLSPYIPKYTQDKDGLHNLISGFSTPGGFPSHINAETPGSIHEGGELGYALSVAFGAVMDYPDLIVTCVVGDGEAETGPTATAWHGYKYIDPAESGAVIPIVHVNGFKISERTIYGTMDDLELIALFTGYGYQVRIVSDLTSIDLDMAASLDWALSEIRHIQHAARSGHPITKPRWPVLILRTPKGWTGPKLVSGEFVEGSFHSHQVPLPNAMKSPEELDALSTWLGSYGIHDLIDPESGLVKEVILRNVPKGRDKKMGTRREANEPYVQLRTPEWGALALQKGEMASCMKAVGRFLDVVVKENPKSFRIFSPDELVSNKLDAVFNSTGRNFQWDVACRAKGGRVIEILSEHTCQGMLQGYTLTGRTGFFPSYESFLGIVHTMMVQYAKFVKMAHETNWRNDVGSLNYLETSTWTRQEHNGFSHQNPSFIGAVLNLKPKLARVYLPPDANCFLSTVSHCLRARNYVNLMVGSKQDTPVWLSPEEADRHCIAGAGIWKFASTEDGVDPDVVLCGIGVEVTFEVVCAASILRKIVPELRVRVVNVTDLMVLSAPGAEGSGQETHPHALGEEAFESLFTEGRDVWFNYHGYPSELRGLLFGRRSVGGSGGQGRAVGVEGYNEEGTTTTPFSMMLANRVSRFHVAAAAVRGGAKHNPAVAVRAHELVSGFMHEAEKAREFAWGFGRDKDDTYDVPKFD